MAKFIFSMQNLLDIKEKLEAQEKNNYSRANLRLQEAEEKRQALQNRQQEAEQELKHTMLSSLHVLEIRQKEEAIEILKMYVRQQEIVVKQREQELEEARIRLSEAIKERKTFEKLREKAFAEFVAEENKKEQKEVDELVSYRYGTGTVGL